MFGWSEIKHAAACLILSAQATSAADITVLGEVHDNADAHLGQAKALAMLKPTAVVFEMLTPEDAARADADRAALAGIWASSNWPDFQIYAPVFAALGPAKLIGAASPRSDIMAIFSEGPAAKFGAGAAQFGLTDPLPADQQTKREALQFEAHCQAMPREMMAGMVHVQRYRDAVMARAALEALDRFGPPVAIITGNGHARTDWGIPALIKRAAPEVTVTATAFVEGATDMPFDTIEIVPPAERDDPCAALR